MRVGDDLKMHRHSLVTRDAESAFDNILQLWLTAFRKFHQLNKRRCPLPAITAAFPAIQRTPAGRLPSAQLLPLNITDNVRQDMSFKQFPTAPTPLPP